MRASLGWRAALLVLTVAFATALASPAAAATSTVTMSENVFWSFSSWSSTVTVRVGDTVTWENRGSQFHNVADDGGTFRSTSLRPGQSYSVTFAKAGEYPYTCTLHVAEEMFGKVIVLPASSTPTMPFHVFIPHTPR